MALQIIDNRTVVDEGDSTTGWTASRGVAVFTSAPDPVESTGSLGQQVSNATETAYHTIVSDNLTDTLIYCWLLPGGVLDTTVNGGVQIYVGDGSNDRGYHVGGSDVAGFRHDDGPVVWQCFVIDTGTLPANTTNFTGAGAPTFSTITRIGNAFKTLAKSVGGTENCFMDIMFYGNNGLTITSTSSTTHTFLDIAIRDRNGADHTPAASTTSGAFGIIRELGTDLIGLQGPLQFGDTGTNAITFEDTGITVVFEDRDIGTNKYGITVTGNGTGNTTFTLGTRDGVGLGSDGCNLVCPTGVGAFFTASNANINSLGLYGCTLSGFDQSVTFTTDGTAGPNHEIFATSFIGCAQIIIGQTEFKNNSISASVATGTTSGAVLIEDTTNVSDLSFTQGIGGGHAIEIADATNSPFTFTDFSFEGYAGADGGTGNEAIVNTSGAAITINVVGGSTPSVDTTNSTGSVTINNNISVTLTGMLDSTEVRVYADGTTTELAGVENAIDGTADNRSFTFSLGAGTIVDIRIFNVNAISENLLDFQIPATNASIPVVQRTDRVYTNP